MSEKLVNERGEEIALLLAADETGKLITIITVDNEKEYEAIPMFRTRESAIDFLERNYEDYEEFFAIPIVVDNVEEQMIVPPLFNVHNSEKVRARIEERNKRR